MVDFAGGTGTALDPYLVATAEQLNEVRNNLSAHFKQTADISLSGYQAGEGWVPIGNSSTRFTGSYDGDFKEITGLKINRRADYQGLFGYVGGTLKKINITATTIAGKDGVGVLCGFSNPTNITDTTVTFEEISGQEWVGGLGGFLSAGTVTDCKIFGGDITATNSSTGESLTGGAWGQSTSLTAARIACEVNDVVSAGIIVGGFCGGERLTANQCYVKANKVQGNEFVAGFCGGGGNCSITDCYCQVNTVVSNTKAGSCINNEQNNTTVTRCYGVGEPSGTLKDGFGWKGGKTFNTSNCFFDKTVAGIAASSYATGKTTAEMKTQATFTGAGWDFVDVWYMPEDGGYPELRAFMPPPPPPPEKLKSNNISIFWGAL